MNKSNFQIMTTSINRVDAASKKVSINAKEKVDEQMGRSTKQHICKAQ
jgi:hypothetical protein